VFSRLVVSVRLLSAELHAYDDTTGPRSTSFAVTRPRVATCRSPAGRTGVVPDSTRSDLDSTRSDQSFAP